MCLDFRIRMFRIIVITLLICISMLPDVFAEKYESPSNLLFRHGDRSPLGSYPKDIYNESEWPQGFGQLTTEGIRQHYAVGQYLRKRYIEGQPYKLLSELYDRYQVHVQSTDYDRTLMSAYSNLAGLFPPQGSQVWNETVTWQPIPVHTVPKESDYLLDVGYGCDNYTVSLNMVYESDWVKNIEQRDKKFYEYVRNSTGVTNFGLRNTSHVDDTLYCQKTHNMSLPDWVNRVWDDGRSTYDKLVDMLNFTATIEYSEPVLSRLTGGPLLGEVVKNMKDKRNGSLPQRAFVYSAHDTTVAAFLSAMETFNNLHPPYAATVVVELFNTSGQFSVEVWYKNDSAHDIGPYQMIIPGCNLTTSCPLDKFIELMQARIPTDWHAECNTPSVASSTSISTTWLIVGVVISAVIVITAAIVIMRVVVRRRQVHTDEELLHAA